jgi:hypothetical protein
MEWSSALGVSQMNDRIPGLAQEQKKALNTIFCPAKYKTNKIFENTFPLSFMMKHFK